MSDLLNPPMYLIGHTYKQLDGDVVLIVGAANQGTSYESVCSFDVSNGNMIHRYNRRDFGRCAGTDHDIPDQRNLVKLPTEPFMCPDCKGYRYVDGGKCFTCQP
jgi:hypothetical protein